MIRAGLRSLLALALLAGVGACDGGEIVVFSPAQAGSPGSSASAGASGLATVAGVGGSFGGALDVAGGGGAASSGTGGIVDNPCRTTSDCDPSWFCEKQDCSAQEGVCNPRPVSDDPVRAPVCDCDRRHSYFNDTLRREFGISASTVGECRAGAQPCRSDDDCPSALPSVGRGSCSRRLPDFSNCGMPGTGQCWITPNDCSSTSDTPQFLPCRSPGMVPDGPTPCLTTCQAVQSGLPYVPSCP
jgi:hypothetical protein